MYVSDKTVIIIAIIKRNCDATLVGEYNKAI